MSQDWVSDSNDSDMFDWESDGLAEPLLALALNNLDASGPSMLVIRVITHRKMCLSTYYL